MKGKKQVCLWVLGMALCFAAPVAAQDAASTPMAEFAKDLKAQLGPDINHLSGAARSFIRLNDQVERLNAMGAALSAGQQGFAPELSESLSQSQLSEMPSQSPPSLAPGKPASTPDITDTRFSGAVQSETSTAWCGKEAVVGFNDSGSLWESNPGGAIIGLVKATTGFSINGYAVSTNSGGKFTDKGFPTVGPLGTFMLGDPVLACTNSSSFFYASLFLDFNSSKSEVSLSLSTDGGQTFGSPKVAVAKKFSGHFLDKDWMTVNEAMPTDIFVT